jgi:hypothetical protein
VGARAVERDHELGDESLSVRALLEQPAKLPHEFHIPSQGQVCVRAGLERPRSKFVEALGLRAAVRVQRNTGEDRAMPKAQCLLREGRGSRVVAGGGRLGGLLHECLEHPRVENGAPEADPVSASPSLEGDAVRREHLAEPRDVCLQAVRCGRRRTVRPDLVDQALVRYDLAGTEQQGPQNGPLLAAA